MGQLHGVPVTTKINTDQTGCPTDNGVRCPAGCAIATSVAAVKLGPHEAGTGLRCEMSDFEGRAEVRSRGEDRNKRLPRLATQCCEAGQSASLLLARCADVHVDFHAHLHFDDLRSLPGHSGLPSDWREACAGLNVEPTPARRKSSTNLAPQRSAIARAATTRVRPAYPAPSHRACRRHRGPPP